MNRSFVTGAGGILLAIATALGIGSVVDDSRNAGEETIDSSGNVLRTTNRESFKVCLDFLDVSPEPQLVSAIRANVESAFSSASTDPRISPSGKPMMVTVEVGCPAAPAAGRPKRVEVPSEYVFFAFVATNEARARVVERVGIPFETQEAVCSKPTEGGLRDSSCFEATSVMYIGQETATDGGSLRLLARQALGLEGHPDNWRGDWRET